MKVKSALVFSFVVWSSVFYYASGARPAMAIYRQDGTRSDTLASGQREVDKEEYPTRETSGLLADRLQCIQQNIPLAYSPRVHSFIEYFTVRNREYSRMVMNRVDTYFPLFSQYLAKYQLPDELKYLAIVESGLSPIAKSPAGAVGLWQFMPATGRHMGLVVNDYIDERKNPERATQAACAYLSQLYTMFGDWRLALMAYNSGPGSVRNAIARAGGRSKKIEEIEARLPAETRSYLSQFIAIKYMLNYSDYHNLFAFQKEDPLACDTILVAGICHLPTLARLAGQNADSLAKLNPSVLRGVLPDLGRPQVIRVPLEVKNAINTNRAAILDSAYQVGKREFLTLENSRNTKQKLSYRVKYGDVLGAIARRFGIKVSEIQKWNKLRGTSIYAGQRLTLWVTAKRSNNRAS